MTNREIVEETGIPAITVNTVLWNLHKQPNRMIHIASYVHMPYNGCNTRPLAAYGVGNKKDAAKPAPLGQAAVQRRIRQQRKKRVNSVFNLGNTNVNTLFK